MEREAKDICRQPSEGEPDHVWWFGFDCAHLWDYVPGIRHYSHETNDVYRDVAYVTAECEKLAQQLSDAA